MAALAPLLMFPTRLPGLTSTALCALAALWVVSWRVRPRSRQAVSLGIAIAVLFVMAGVGLLVTPSWGLSWPKFTGIVLGIATMRAVWLAVLSRSQLETALALYLAACVAFAIVGLLSTSLSNKFLSEMITSRLPARLLSVAADNGGVNPNALGATTLFLLPLAATLACGSLLNRKAGVGVVIGMRLRLLSVCGLAIGLGVLLLSQSRTSWLAFGTTLVATAAVRWKWIRWWAVGIGLAGVVVAGLVLQAGRFQSVGEIGEVTTPVSGSAVLSLQARAEIWSRASDAIEDFPLTGVGLNAFRVVLPVMYPLTLVPRDFGAAHAHNVFLQTALDVGIPGLIAYLALLMVATHMCWQTYTAGDAMARWVVLGLGGNLLAIHLFGVTDAVALGTKIGAFFWWNLGMIAALHRLTRVSEAVKKDSSNGRS